MATTDHPLVLDLGSVVGPRGPSGVATTSGVPAPSVGSNGDVMIDPDTGIFYKKIDGTWSAICTVILAPLDTEIDGESENPVTNAAISAALDGKAPVASEMTEVPFQTGGVGTYDGAHRVNRFGQICFLNISSANRDESVWKMPINVGASSSESTTKILRLPDGIRPSKADYVIGRLLTAERAYRAEFTVASAYGDNPGYISINAVLDDDFNRVRDGSDNVVTQFTATGFNLSVVYRIGTVQAAQEG